MLQREFSEKLSSFEPPDFVSTKQQPQCFVPPGTMLGAVNAVRILLSYSPSAFLFAFLPGYHPAWGLTAGTVLLLAALIVACRYHVSVRAIFQRISCDERKLYSTRV